MTTRRFPQALAGKTPFGRLSLYQTELFNRLGWFIQLRWLGICGLLLGLLYFYLRMGPSPTLARLFWLILFIAVYNLAFFLVNRHMRDKTEPARWKNISFALLQIFADLVSLTLVVHGSGGVASIFVIYYVFLLVMASLLLYRWVCYVVAGFTSAALDLVVYLEASEILPHCPMRGLTLGYYYDMDAAIDSFSQPVFLPCLLYNAAFFITVTIASTISRRLRQREREIEAFNFQLNDVNIAKSIFMRKASHEMRGPLAALEGMLNIFASKMGDNPPDPECEEILDRCAVRLESMYELINDLLAYSRLQSVNIEEHLAPLDWGSVVAKSLEDLEPAAQSMGIEIRADINSCEILGVEEQFLTLGNNLIHNALRYTPEGGKIEIRLGRENNQALLEIEDNGIGIDPPAIGFVFEEFFRAPNAKKHDVGGTGLGLTICKNIVENHGGTISVASVPHHRTVFSVRIPLK